MSDRPDYIADQGSIEEISDGIFGQCTQCGHDLEENEFAISDICDSCRPAFMEAWESRHEAAQEEAEERRMYPEESDDDSEAFNPEE
jgi:hypothetical protein